MFRNSAIAALFLVAAASTAAASPAPTATPKAGSVGFNWLDPENAECKEFGAEDVAGLTACEASENAFGLESPSLMCKVDADTEWVIYETAAQCQAGLETMQANGD